MTTEKPSMSFEVLERSITGWQAKTFPSAHPLSLAAHLLSECVELARSLGMSEDAICTEVGRSIAKPVKDRPEKELGDVVHLVIGMAKALDSDVVRVTLPVYQDNRSRTWGAPDPVTGVVEHVEYDDEDPTLNERPTTQLQSVVKEVLFALGRDDEGPRETDRVYSLAVEGVRISFQHTPSHAVIVRVSSELNGTIALFTRQAHHEYTVGEMRACLGADAWHGASA